MFANLKYYVSLTTGLVLFGIGFLGVFEIPLSLGPEWTVLLTPLGYAHWIDTVYFALLAALGFWLTLCMAVRIPAGIGLGLVTGKILLLGARLEFGYLVPILLTAALLTLVFRFTEPTRALDWTDSIH